MAVLQNVSAISLNGATTNLEVTYGATPIQQNYGTSSGQTLKMTRNGSQWDLDISSGEVTKEKVLMNFPSSYVNIDFGEEVSGGNAHYFIIIIGEDDIRDGLAEDNQFLVGMKSTSISVKTSGGVISIKKA